MKYLINGMVMLIFFLSKSLLAICPDPNCGVIIEHTEDTGKHKSECRLLLQYRQLSDKLSHIREPEKLPMSLESINSNRKKGTLHQHRNTIESLNLTPIFQPEEIDFLVRIAAQALPVNETDFKLTIPSETLTDSVSIVRLYLAKPIALEQDHHQEYGKFLALTAICCLMIISESEEAEAAEDISPKATELTTAINNLWNIALPDDNDAPPNKSETIESDQADHHETRESIENYFKDRLSEINKCKEFHIDPKSPPSPDDLLRAYLDNDETDNANGVLKFIKTLPLINSDSSEELIQNAVDEISAMIFIKCFHKHKQCFFVSRDFYLQAPFPFPENRLMPFIDSILEVRRRQRNIQSLNRSLSQHDQRPENTRHSQTDQHQPVEPRIVFPWHRALMPISAILCSAGHAIWRKEVKPYHFIIPTLTIVGELARLSLEPGSTQPKRQTHRKSASMTASIKSSSEVKE